MALPINSWSDLKKVVRQLKDEKAKAKYETIVIDTIDLAYDFCEKYICANNNVDTISEIGYGKGFKLAAKEFDELLRTIVQRGYGLVMISHATDKTFKDQNGQEYNQIVPTLENKPRNIVSRMADIIGYSRCIDLPEGGSTTRLFLRGTPRYVAGSRFKYTPDSIEFNYQSLVKAIGDAIDRQEQEEGKQYFTDTISNLYDKQTKELDFDALIKEFNDIVTKLVSSNTEEKFEQYFQPRIIQITERYLGKGGKVSQCSREQVEALDLIVTELRDLK